MKYASRKLLGGPLGRNQQINRTLNEPKKTKPLNIMEVSQSQKPPLPCWGCGETHYYKNFPHHTRTKMTANVQEASTVGEVTKNIPIINVVVEHHQEEYQSTMVEFKCKITNQSTSILIDPRTIISYVSLEIAELCHLSSSKFKNLLLVQLATREK